MNKSKLKEIKIKMSEKEMNAIEDIFFCRVGEKKYDEIVPHLRRVWKRLCKEMEK